MEQATFSFKKYSVDNFTFDSKSIVDENISIKIDPSGVFNTNDRIFFLKFEFYAFGKELGVDKSFVTCTMNAEFVFSEKIKVVEDIPSYFFANSIAIVFPYLRSFISSLTVQANLKPFILPTMNLTSLSVPLKENVVVE